MTASDFLYQAQQLIYVEWARLQKLAVGLRKMSMYPDGRERGEQAHVKTSQAAHMIRLMSINANPFADDFIQKIQEHERLISKEGDFFTIDFSEILYHGCLKSQRGLVHHISFSLDRPRVVIVFEDRTEETETEEGHIIQFEKVYGEGEIRPFERWGIIKQKAILNLSMWLTDSNHIGDDNDKALKFYQHINELK